MLLWYLPKIRYFLEDSCLNTFIVLFNDFGDGRFSGGKIALSILCRRKDKERFYLWRRRFFVFCSTALVSQHRIQKGSQFTIIEVKWSLSGQMRWTGIDAGIGAGISAGKTKWNKRVWGWEIDDRVAGS
jgi:hypothetical protein